MRRPRRVVPRADLPAGAPWTVRPSVDDRTRRRAPRAMDTLQYRTVPPQVDLPAMEREILAFWREHDTFARTLKSHCWPPGSGRSTRARRPPTACPAPTTSRPASSRTSSRATGPCAGTTCPARPAGTATACRSRSPSRRSWASPASPTSRPTASPSSTRSAASRSSATSTRSRRMTERMGYWVDMTTPTARWTRPTSRASGGRSSRSSTTGCSCEDHRVAPYCPRCGTGLSDHELAPGLRDRRRPVGLRPLPAHLRPVRRHGVSAGLDDDAVDAGLQHRGCGPPGRHLRGRHRRHRDARRRRAAVRRCAGRGLDRRQSGDRRRDGAAGATSGRSTSSTYPSAATSWSSPTYVTTEDGTGLVHQAPAFGADDLRVCPRATACPWSTRYAPTALSQTTCPWSAASSSSTPTRRW